MLLLSIALAEDPSAETLRAVWVESLPALQAHSRMPVITLEEGAFDELAKGEVVRFRRQESDTVDGAVGVAWVPYSPEDLWLGAIDDVHQHLADGLTEQWLPGTVPGHKVLYQHFDVPAPFDDRHWVIVIDSNKPLYEASSSVIWERTWDLDERGTAALEDVPEDTVEAPEDALWTPVNRGGWLMIPCEGGSLIVYQVSSDIGGNIPEEMVVRFAMASLGGMIGHLEELAQATPEHYVDDHFVILRPDGQPIPTR
jgi:hypothetical protein